MTVFRAATLRTFFFAFHAGAKELSYTYGIVSSGLAASPKSNGCRKIQNLILWLHSFCSFNEKITSFYFRISGGKVTEIGGIFFKIF